MILQKLFRVNQSSHKCLQCTHVLASHILHKLLPSSSRALELFAVRDPEWNHSTVELGICELLPEQQSIFRVSAESLALSRQPSARWDLQRQPFDIIVLSHCVLFALSVAKNTGCCSHREIMASSVRNPPDSLSAACLRHVGGRTDWLSEKREGIFDSCAPQTWRFPINKHSAESCWAFVCTHNIKTFRRLFLSSSRFFMARITFLSRFGRRHRHPLS